MERIGIDLDGVLYPFISAVETYCRINQGFTGTTTEFYENAHEYFDKYNIHWLVDSPDMYYKFVPDKDIMAFIERLNSKFQIFYITSRPESSRRVTEKWLRDFKFPQDNNLIFTKEKDVYARLLQLNYFVEDNVENAEKLSSTCMSFLIDLPYNKNVEGNFIRIRSLLDLEGTLL